MELIYVWIEKFRNDNNVEIKFSNRFNISYSKEKQEIDIKRNDSYVDIYPEHITNVNAIVGKNSVGKTNLLDLLGLKASDRNKNNAEFETKYKRRNNKFGFTASDIEEEIKHSIYFFVFFYGKDDYGNDLFLFEGNDIESYVDLIKDKDVGLDVKYFSSKYWFPFICRYKNGKFIKLIDLNERLNGYIKEGKIYGDHRSEQDKLAIISLRGILNSKYYDYLSTKPEDDYKISVPRRVATFNTKFLSSKVEMLHQLLMNPKRQMYKDNNYVLKIKYDTNYLTDYNDENAKNMKLSHTYKDCKNPKKQLLRVIEAYVRYFYNSIANILISEKRETDLENLKNSLVSCKIDAQTIEQYKQYYFNIVKSIAETYFNKGDAEIIYEDYILFVNELLENSIIKFDNEYIFVEINKNAEIKKILKFIGNTYDAKLRDYNQTISAFEHFFEYYTIDDLSDGENTYLGIFASLNEQITKFTNGKSRYIILLDEPESRMHPELARNFINELIKFLNDINQEKKKYQIIISTHSPFMLSDIHSDNIIYLQKDEWGYCIPVQKKLNTFGVNIHTLLKDGFFMESTMGEYALEKINEVISFLNTEEDSKLVNDNHLTNKREAKYIISLIGEPIVKNKLEQMFYDKFPEERSLEEQIVKYKEQINSLQNQLINGKIMDKKILSQLKSKLQDTLDSISSLVKQDGDSDD